MTGGSATAATAGVGALATARFCVLPTAGFGAGVFATCLGAAGFSKVGNVDPNSTTSPTAGFSALGLKAFLGPRATGARPFDHCAFSADFGWHTPIETRKICPRGQDCA